MLKLKNLFDNRDLTKMILENWEYDPSSLDMFDYYRISSNAVYPFKNEGNVKSYDMRLALRKIKTT